MVIAGPRGLLQKTANGGSRLRNHLVLPCRLLWRQVSFGAPASWATFQHVTVVQQAVEHGADGGRIAQQLALVFHGTVGGQHGASAFVSPHDDLQ